MRSFLKTSRTLAGVAAGLLSMQGSEACAGTTVKEIKPLRSHKGKQRDYSHPSSSVKKGNRTRKEFHPVATPDDPYGDEQVREANDPFEKVNRATFAFNHQFYRFIARPLADLTRFILRDRGLEAASNVFENIEAPVRIVSSLLQAKVHRAGQETGKLLLNSTVGVGGLWKPSERIDSLKNVPSEDVGQAFGSWGIPAGQYLVVPILGPSSTRDLVGKAGDTCLQPLTWVGGTEFRTWYKGTKTVVENPNRMETYDNATVDAVDPYIALREAYTSYRKAAVQK